MTNEQAAKALREFFLDYWRMHRGYENLRDTVSKAVQLLETTPDLRPMTLEEARQVPVGIPVWVEDLLIAKCSEWCLVASDRKLGKILLNSRCTRDKYDMGIQGAYYRLLDENGAYGRTWQVWPHSPEQSAAWPWELSS